MKGISRYLPGGTGKTPFCAKRAFRGAGVRRRQPQGRRHPCPSLHHLSYEQPPYAPYYIGCTVVVVGRDGEPTPQCPDVWHGRLLRWGKSNPELGEVKPRVGGRRRPRWGNSNLRTGELKPPYREDRTLVQGNLNPRTGEKACGSETYG